jgi:exodeoxyribonuclease VII small subunit
MAKKRASEKSTRESTNDATSIEDSMDELQEIVQVLESGQEPLDVSLQKFERGMGLLRECHRQLDDAAQRIEILTRIGADGTIETAPFDATTTLSKEQSSDHDLSDDNSRDTASLF